MTRLHWLLVCLALAACGDAPPDVLGAPERYTPAGAALPGGEATAWVSDDSTAGESVLWVQAATGRPVEVARGSIGASPQAGVRLVPLGGDALAAVWVEEQAVEGRRFPATTLRAATSADGGQTWARPVTVNPDPGFPSSHTFHSAAAGPGGALYVAWLDGSTLDGTTRDRARRDAPSAEAGDHGGMHTMHGADGPGTDVVVAVSRDGGRSFEAPVTVARGTCECCRTALAVASDGAVSVAWRHLFDGDQRDVAVATSRDGGRTFSAPVRVHRDGWALGGCPHAGPALASGADGLHVAWPTGAEGHAGLSHAVSADGGATFGAPTALARGPLGQVRAATGGDGRVWLAWEDTARQRVGLVAAGASDTLYAPGTAPDLAGGEAGPLAVWLDGGRLATHIGG